MKTHIFRIVILSALTVLVVSSCEIDSKPTTTQNGSLQGRVTEGTPAAAAAASAASSRRAQAPPPDVLQGAGLPGVRVTVFLRGELETTETALDNPKTTDVDEGGYFTIRGMPTGVLLPVTFDREGYVTLNGNVEIPAVAGSGDSAIPLKDPVASIEVAMVKGTGSASLNLDRLIKFKGLLQGIVVDGTPGSDKGKALGDVTISLFASGTLITAKSKSDDATTPFDETGYFSIGNLPPGQPISATFEKAGYQKTRITITIPVTEGTKDPAVNVEVKLIKGDSAKIIEDTVQPLPFNGTIQGIIRDGTVGSDFGKPLSGVSVSALVLGKIVETTSKEDDPLTPGFDETGFFALNNLPVGLDIPVRFKADGYVPVTSVISLTATNLGASTTFGQDIAAQVTRDIDLVKDTASLLVVVYAGKGPANGATVVLDLTNVTTANLSNSLAGSVGVTFGSGFELRQVKTTDDKGQATFTNLPPIVIPGAAIVVQPFDEDKGADANPDYKTTTAATAGIASIDLRQLTAGAGPSVVRINLLTFGSIVPTVVWSNVVTNAVLNTKDNLTFIFDLPMDTLPVVEVKDSSGKVTTEGDPKNASFAVTLTDPAGQPVPFKSTWKDNVTLEVDPFSDLQPTNQVNFDPTAACAATCYTVTVQARSIQGVFMNEPTAQGGPPYLRRFKVTEKAGALTSPTPATWPNPAPGVGTLNWNTLATGIIIQWPQDGNATGYSVYAKDNMLNKDWVRIGAGLTFPTTAATTHSPTIVYPLAALPTQFDKCVAGADGSPCDTDGAVNGTVVEGVEALAFGGQLILAVTALNRDGIESALDDTKALTIGDNTPPSIVTANLGFAAQTALVNQVNVSTLNTAANNANCPFGTAGGCTAAKRIRIRLTGFPEPMSGSGGSVTVLDAATAACNAGLGTNANNGAVTIAAGPTWSESTNATLRPGLREIYVDVDVPANTSGVGECIRFNLANVSDVAGNTETLPTPTVNPDMGLDGSENNTVSGSETEIYMYKMN